MRYLLRVIPFDPMSRRGLCIPFRLLLIINNKTSHTPLLSQDVYYDHSYSYFIAHPFVLFQIAPASKITKRDPTCQNIVIPITFSAPNAAIGSPSTL